MSRCGLVLALLAGVALSLLVLGPASARTSKYGGTLVVGMAGEPDSLDPTVGTNASRTPINTMCLRLYEYAYNHGKLELAPVLAAAPPALSKDKLSYTIQLRQGIQFNDGTPFNAQAVVTTFQRFMTYPGSLWASDFAGVDSVTATGPYTVVYHLKQRDSTFSGNMYVLSPTALAKEGANFAANPVCVGPFMFDHRVVGDNVTLVKSPYYYERSAVYLDKIVFKPMPDAAAAAAALKAGDIQVLDRGRHDVAAGRAAGLEPAGALGAPARLGRDHDQHRQPRTALGNLPYTNVGTPLAQSAKLRQAFEEAIDRNTLNRVVFGGLYRPSCTLIPPANTLWYDADEGPLHALRPGRREEARRRVGLPEPDTVHLLTSNTTALLRLAQFIQAQEAAVGINVVIDSVDQPTRTGADGERALRHGHRPVCGPIPSRTPHLQVIRHVGRA